MYLYTDSVMQDYMERLREEKRWDRSQYWEAEEYAKEHGERLCPQDFGCPDWDHDEYGRTDYNWRPEPDILRCPQDFSGNLCTKRMMAMRTPEKQGFNGWLEEPEGSIGEQNRRHWEIWTNATIHWTTHSNYGDRWD